MIEKIDTPENLALNEIFINCPSCQNSVAYTDKNENRPFCSADCKNKDIISWANEDFNLIQPISLEHEVDYTSSQCT